jgi:hypothetical protein
MLKVYYSLLIFILIYLLSCGTPNDPATVVNDGGYRVVGKIATMGHAQDVVVDDTLAFVAQGEGGLLIINISNPVKPAIISSVLGEDLKGYTYKVAKKDSAIYLAAGNFGLSVVDISDPLLPVASEVNLPVKPAKDFHVFGEFLLTGISELGVKISWVRVSTHPDVRGGMGTPGFASGLCSSADSNYIVVACGEMGIALFDVSELITGHGTYPMVGWIDTPGDAEDVVAHPTDPYAFVACGTGGFTIVNFADTANLKIESTVVTGGYAKELLYKDGKVFVATELRGVQIFDVTNVSAPVQLGTVATQYALGLGIDDKYIYVADEVEGLIIIAIP